jgi:flagellar protein FlaI
MKRISSRGLFKTLVRGYKISMLRKIKREIRPEVVEVIPKKIEISPKVEEEKIEIKPKKLEVEGVEIPSTLPPTVKIAKPPKEEKEKILLVYPLIPKKPAPKDLVFAYAKIFWNKKENRYVYQVVEPELTERLTEMLKKIRTLLEQKLDVDFSKLTKAEAKEYLRKKMEEAIGYYGFKLHPIEKEVLHYYAERDFIGLGKIEPLMNDDQIEDISCDGLGIPIFVFHRNPMIGSVVTNVVYKDAEELDSFIIRLSQLCGKSVSVASPLLNGSLPDGSRVQATLATDIARKGSNFTIRKFTESPLTPVHLLLYNTLDTKILAYLWLCVEYGASMFISGGTATGKTSLLNVLSLFIRPEEKIVSIEDTAELRLPHPHWVPQVARVPIATEKGEVDLFALLKESLRQRPDYIIVGEVRGPEAFVLFQQIATGHPSLATIHAEDMPKLVDRLITPPISLPPALIENLNLVIFLLQTRYKGKQVRRVNEVLEIIGFDREKNSPITNLVFKWNPTTDTFDVVNKSVLLKKFAAAKGMSEKEVAEELQRRMLVLNWMLEQNVLDYRDVFKIITTYYTQPEVIISLAKG